ncbi:hypothetical protein HanRHA438_Chr11g0515051 [Helianthus annuus]|nr:hypothetical protein HanIR_Chr11g0540851 [Helianthus annuus]KAJ0871664.1 hypothetical protein HanRHA438_Chr11g0515051 [Helianthus annuus]
MKKKNPVVSHGFLAKKPPSAASLSNQPIKIQSTKVKLKLKFKFKSRQLI